MGSETRSELLREVGETVSEYLWNLSSVEGVMLCGSSTKGFADEQSDVDVGCFCDLSSLDPEEYLEQVDHLGATNLREDGAFRQGAANLWGSIEYEGTEVDIIFHSTDQIRERIDQFLDGDIPRPREGIHVHPFGKEESFLAHTVANCEILYETDSVITEMQDDLRAYPEELHDEFVWRRLVCAEWMVENMLEKTASRDDYLYVEPASARLLRMLTMAVFSLNEVYLPSNKWHSNYLESFDVLPEEFLSDLQKLRATSAESEAELHERVDILGRMVENTWQLAEAELDQPSPREN